MPEKPSKNEDEDFARRDAELLRQQRQQLERAAEAERVLAHAEPNTLGRVFRAVLRGISGAPGSPS
jgi:hypothetical protein